MIARVLAVWLLVTTGSIAGCLGLGGAQSDVTVTDFDADWTEAGTLAVQVTVTNRGDAEGTGTLVVVASFEGADPHEERRDVRLAPGRSETVRVVFEPPEDMVGSSYDVRARID